MFLNVRDASSFNTMVWSLNYIAGFGWNFSVRCSRD